MSPEPPEKRRYDGAPAPKRNAGIGMGDVKAAAQEARENAQCAECGHDDFDDLTRKAAVYVPSCSAVQSPPGAHRPIVLCDDCAADHTPEQDYIDELQDDTRVMVLYECGGARAASKPKQPTITVDERMGWDEEAGKPITEKTEIKHPHKKKPVAQIDAECQCGAQIDEVYY